MTEMRSRLSAAGSASGAVERAAAVDNGEVGSSGVGGGADMIGPKLPDTKLVGARALPVLGRRLYGKEEG